MRDRPPARRAPPPSTRRASTAPGADAQDLSFAPQDQEAYDRLATMVAVVRADGRCLLANAALENAIRQSRRRLVRGRVTDWFEDPAPLQAALQHVAGRHLVVSRFEALLRCQPPGTHALPVRVIASPIGRGGPDAALMLEMIEIERQVQLDREARMHDLVQAHRELLRNLAHEVRNPLGGIRGAAQLLALDAVSRDLADYTDVIIREADRLQALVDRLLAPHRGAPAWRAVNVHEVCERVRILVLAEFPAGLEVRRDYDTSLPELRGDPERLIQALLNIVRNAAQALAVRIASGDACIVLRTRVARQVTLDGRRHRLAIELQVEDNGPGVPAALLEQVFQPLVSGDPGGHGLGLTLAQALVQQHGGTIACESRPGCTRFTLLFPLAQDAGPPTREPAP
ncbi:MAG TPA: nitrogen regulation protein NR(II) [Ottowia sp.]|uniref:nitrogen regulation protein NR(II) n=1 Tax=Ottowia sp. TaxID=1898956 RepID=UPI002BB42923|nr:nitrogen regulation protein NR(II) [Ottowia sp.]HMN20669.1 nitrogen regulation protein NR(II) [Ottowia sp.]